MVLHDFIYEWDGKTKDGQAPVSWWPGAYHVKIVKLSKETENVSFLVPTAVLLKNAKITTMNTSLRNYIHVFARKISKKYNLDMEKTLWIELDDTIRVTRINTDPNFPDTILFAVPWRDIRPNELELIKEYIQDM
jgi:hypothetical protein